MSYAVIVFIIFVMLLFVYSAFFFPFSGLPIFTKSPPSVIAPKEFTTLQESCRAEGFPPPKVTWTRLAMPVPAGKTEIKDGNLTIKNVRSVDGGSYQCIATNKIGTKKATMNVNVQGKGVLIIRIKSVSPT